MVVLCYHNWLAQLPKFIFYYTILSDNCVVLPQLSYIITIILLLTTQYYLDSSVVLPLLDYMITDVLLSTTHYYLDNGVVLPKLPYTIT